ncbi:hypothetical protein OQA88_5963 [Cercophora sp. LCS_1]
MERAVMISNGHENGPGLVAEALGPDKGGEERVHLLIHILRLIIEPPEMQHPDIQKLNFNVKKLEELTMESLASLFNNRYASGIGLKKRCLKEIFKVARHEEQFQRGEIDATVEIFVMTDAALADKEGLAALSLDDEGAEHDDSKFALPISTPTPQMTPPRMPYPLAVSKDLAADRHRTRTFEKETQRDVGGAASQTPTCMADAEFNPATRRKAK